MLLRFVNGQINGSSISGDGALRLGR